MTCQNPGCRDEAKRLYRELTIGSRMLCLSCLAILNAMGMDWRPQPVWLERAARGEQRGSDQTGRLVA